MPPGRRRSLVKPILLAGLIAGTLDILDPIVFYGIRSHTPAIRVLQSVASGVLGPRTFAGGWSTAALGLAIHFCIATCWAALFVLAARAVPALRRYAVLCGLLYGLFVYVVMNYVVIPLSLASHIHPHVPIVLINAVCAIVFLIGLPIALINRRFA